MIDVIFGVQCTANAIIDRKNRLLATIQFHLNASVNVNSLHLYCTIEIKSAVTDITEIVLLSVC